MKKGIHPAYKELEIIISGDVFKTMSTKGGVLHMDVDYRKHPAWTKKGIATADISDKNVSDFNKKFAGLDFLKPKTTQN